MRFLLFIWCSVLLASTAVAQSLDFWTTDYYLANGTTLTNSAKDLVGFNFSSALRTHPLFGGGLYYPIQDFENNNLWVRLRHIANDPNGTTVGTNVTGTMGDPFRAGLGGWFGFLYQFDIYADANLTGTRANTLAGLYPNNIIVESLETLSAGEWLSFTILNQNSSGWFLISKAFTGRNPGSNPGFGTSPESNYWRDNPGTHFSATFPNGSDSVHVVDLGGRSFAEFKLGANQVTSFKYGYEHTNSGGYQGMTLSFGRSATVATRPGLPYLRAWPSPTTGMLHVAGLAGKTARLVNAIGTSVRMVTEGPTDITDLPPGLYTILSNGIAPQRVIKL